MRPSTLLRAAAAAKNAVVVIGSAGALGAATSRIFRAAGWATLGVDMRAEQESEACVVLPSRPGAGVAELQSERSALAVEKISSWARSTGSNVRAVVCTAGGWRGGKVGDAGVFASTAELLDMCFWPTIMAGHVAAKVLTRTDGSQHNTLVITGAAAARGPTPDMVGYGMIKAATHQLVRSLASEHSGLPANTLVFGILPTVIDTPGNRAGMPGADTSSWVHPDDIARKIVETASSEDTAVSSGALLVAKKTEGVTSFEPTKAR